MKLTFWDMAWQGNRRSRIFLSAMSAFNVVFAAANVFYWSSLAMILADPIAWATWSSLGSISHRPELGDYPFVLLWTLPLLGSGIAAINHVLGFRRMARVAALFPLSLIGLTICCWTLFRDSI